MDRFNKSAFGELVARCGCGILVIAIVILVMVSMCGCRTTRLVTETITKTDTVTVRHDSIIIHDRIVPVEVELPPSIQYVEIPISQDTVSVLSDKFYTSTAAVLDGRLRHSLKSNPGASLTGSATVHDTVKVYVDSTAINSSTSHSQVKEVPVYKMHWWQRLLMWLGVAAAAGGIYMLRKPLLALLKKT